MIWGILCEDNSGNDEEKLKAVHSSVIRYPGNVEVGKG